MYALHLSGMHPIANTTQLRAYIPITSFVVP